MNLSNIQKGTDDHEDDISAEENFSFESPRLSGENGDKGRKKSFSQTQSKRQKSFISLKKEPKTTVNVVFSSIYDKI